MVLQVHLLKVNRLLTVLSGSQSTLRNPMERAEREERTALRAEERKSTKTHRWSRFSLQTRKGATEEDGLSFAASPEPAEVEESHAEVLR